MSLHGVQVVILSHQGILSKGRSNAGAIGDTVRRRAGARFDQKGIGVAVVATTKLYYLVTPGEGPGQP